MSDIKEISERCLRWYSYVKTFVILGLTVVFFSYGVFRFVMYIQKTPPDPGEVTCIKVCYPHGLWYRVGNQCKCDLSIEFRDIKDPHLIEQR